MNTTTRKALAGLTIVAATLGGSLVGRTLQSDDTPAASPTATVSDTILDPDGNPIQMAAPAEVPAAFDATAPADPAGGSAIEPVVGGEPVVGAGTLEPNPGGAPDLTADPEAGIEGTPPVAAAPASPGPIDDGEAFEAITTRVEEAAETSGASGAPFSIPSEMPGAVFSDPCVRLADDQQCVGGVQAIVLGDRPLPAVQTLWFGQVRQSDLYAAECSRQYPLTSIDWRNETIFAVAVNVPVVARLDLQLNTPGVVGSLIRRSRPGEVVTTTIATSGDLANAWGTAYVAGARTPSIPLCVRVSKEQMDRNRDGCLAELVGTLWFTCQAPISISVRTGCESYTTDPLCSALQAVLGSSQPVPRVAKGPLQTTYDYDPQWDGWDEQFGGTPGGTQDFLRRPVQLVGVDQMNLEVRIPTSTVTLGDATLDPTTGEGTRVRLQQHQLVAAAGYAPGTDCRTVDPTVLTTQLAVTRQIARTRYWTPDSAFPANREAIVNLIMPNLAQGEAVDICVFWYLLPERSYDQPIVTAIERHTVVPPSRAATELTFVQLGDGGNFPHSPSLDEVAVSLAPLGFQILGQTALSRSLNLQCGFTVPALTPPQPVLRPIGEPGFLCRIESSAFLFDPHDIELWGGFRNDPDIQGRTRINIDHRGCPTSGCGSGRVVRINLSDGRWIDIAVRKVPLAVDPLLPNGRSLGTWSDRDWLIDPAGFTAVAPTLRTPIAGPTPALDIFGVRVAQNPASPTTALDVVWSADRAVTVQVSASVLNPSPHTQQCAQTLVTGEPLVASATLTIPRLCPNTEYGIRLILTDAAGQERVYEWFTGGMSLGVLGVVPQWNLVGRTAPEPVPTDFLYDWSLSIGSVRGTVNFDTVISDLTVRVGNETLVNRIDAPGSCTRVSPNTPTAAGFGSATALGQLRLYVSYTLTTPSGANCAGRSTTVSFVVDTTAVWDGRSEQTFTLRAADGSEVFLTLGPASGD